MKVALCYDRVNKFGGAERVLLALHRIWPDAPLYTAVYDPDQASWAHPFQVRESPLGRMIPLSRRHHELFAWATPIAFESFDFSAFDCVISVTSAEAKSIITKPETVHICYCLTPTRYLWSGAELYQTRPGLGIVSRISSMALRIFAPTLRSWDLFSAARPDAYVAISHHVASRIKAYYKRTVDCVVYPPVTMGIFHPGEADPDLEKDPFYLLVSRLVSYKRIDVVVDAFTTLGQRLVVVGTGHEKSYLRRMGGPSITFIDELTERELALYYRSCRALVFAGDEDFGLAAAEAQASGAPVVAYRTSGISEIVQDGKTGVLFDTQSSRCVIDAVRRFERMGIRRQACVQSAQRFTETLFSTQMKNIVTQALHRKQRYGVYYV